MRRDALATVACIVAIFISFGASSGHAADLIWQVENPFRFFKPTRLFALHEAAFNAVRGNPAGPLPADIVLRTERRLNDPDCRDLSNPDRCEATAGRRWAQSRLGWAAQTLGETCYESNGVPHRYHTTCERKYSWGAAKEDYVLPEAHTVVVQIAPEQLVGVTGACIWAWQPRKPGGRAETRRLACNQKLTIARVPYSLDRAGSGVSVTVKLPDGRELADSEVVVEDIFIVALGDSFASGESNPDRPVTFGAREMVYDPAMAREDVAAKKPDPAPGFGLASGDDQYNPKVLPRRFMEDEAGERYNKLSSAAFNAAFDKSGARWLSRDCHRSQYGYPFRVGIQLALENRHRSITLASLTCSGAEVTAGLFQEMDSREGLSDPKAAKVRPQLDQLSDLICRGGAGARSQGASYVLPMYATGSTRIEMRKIDKLWCPPQLRKRPIDVVLMSIGGNDVGFGGLLSYSMTESASDFAPIATWIGSQIRFSPEVARVYLQVLDARMKAVKDALAEGFGVAPTRVLQSSYEPAQFDETGAVCGAQPTLGMDVHPGLKLSRARLQEASDFLRDFLARLECITSTKGRSCPANLATGAGTGFTLVVDHIPEFTKRGLCARDPKRALADAINMRVPRKTPNGEAFNPYSPSAWLPYAHQWRLFRTPNDAFLTANTHREGISPFDILQPAYAGLFSGAIHPTAEGHAIVADHVVRHVRALIDKRSVADNAAK
jgi:lysophospholipase L1-like esterase